MDTKVRDALERAAKHESHSISNMIEKICAVWLRKKGYLQKDEHPHARTDAAKQKKKR